jgi:hypothetical protein
MGGGGDTESSSQAEAIYISQIQGGNERHSDLGEGGKEGMRRACTARPASHAQPDTPRNEETTNET